MIITIQHYQFDFPDGYAEGHPLTVGEAQALNALRAENIRKIAGRRLREQLANFPVDYVLSKDELERFEFMVRELAAVYEFKSYDPKPKAGLFTKTLREVAEEKVTAAFRILDMEPRGETFEAAVAEAEHEAQVIDEARGRVGALREMASATLEDLL